MSSGALAAALKELTPAFERASGSTLIVVSGGSVAGAPDSIPDRLRRGERADVLIGGGRRHRRPDEGRTRGRGSRVIWRAPASDRGPARAPRPGHQHRRRAQARAARGLVGRIFLERQRRMSRPSSFSAWHRRRCGPRRARWRASRSGRSSPAARRRSDSADQRAEAGGRSRGRRTAAASCAARHRLFRRGRHRLAQPGGRPRTDRLPRVAERVRRDCEERYGPAAALDRCCAAPAPSPQPPAPSCMIGIL